MSQWVRPEDILRNFKRYIGDYDGMVTHTEQLVEELQDAIDDAEYIEIDDE